MTTVGEAELVSVFCECTLPDYIRVLKLSWDIFECVNSLYNYVGESGTEL